jgi:hypothetical protein
MVPAMPATAEVDEGHQWIGASRGMVAWRDKGKGAACAGWAQRRAWGGVRQGCAVTPQQLDASACGEARLLDLSAVQV